MVIRGRSPLGSPVLKTPVGPIPVTVLSLVRLVLLEEFLVFGVIVTITTEEVRNNNIRNLIGTLEGDK